MAASDSNPARPATSFPKGEIQVLLLENIHPSAHALFRAEGFQLEVLSGALKEEELKKKIANAHVLGIRSKTYVSAAALAEARRLLTIGCFCIGTNQVELEAAKLRGVPVFNAPFSNTRSVAEMIIGEIVALGRQLGDRSNEMHRGVWRKVATACHEIRGKTLGIVGYGHIGRQLGVMAEMMGLNVVFFDIATRLPMGNNRSLGSMKELLQISDFVSLHVPATPQTHEMIGEAELAAMKKGACLLNASRGTVVQIGPLAAALKSGHLAGAAVDVFPEEPEANGEGFRTELQGLPNVLLTPHIGGSTEEAQENIGREVATSLIKFVNAGATTGAVNFPQIDAPPLKDAHRIINVHKNQPGVLRDINKIVSDANANIEAQVLATDPKIGYLLMDIDQDASDEVRAAMVKLDTNIKTRVLY
jgi:D-3-phosphoglycerate dehydrogenase